MYVNVKYQNSDGVTFQNRTYTYKTKLALRVGDLVYAPTYKGDVAAKVVEINVPETKIDERVLPQLREITFCCRDDFSTELMDDDFMRDFFGGDE